MRPTLDLCLAQRGERDLGPGAGRLGAGVARRAAGTVLVPPAGGLAQRGRPLPLVVVSRRRPECGPVGTCASRGHAASLGGSRGGRDADGTRRGHGRNVLVNVLGSRPQGEKLPESFFFFFETSSSSVRQTALSTPVCSLSHGFKSRSNVILMKSL